MRTLLRGLILPTFLIASCGGGASVVSSTASPTFAPVTTAATTLTPNVAATTPAPTAAANPSNSIAATDCTSTTATTRQIVERLFALSTSNDARAVSDCYAQSYRDKNPNFADSAALWSREGPATNLAVTFVDTANGCDRFRATAQMPNNPFWTSGQAFYSVGPEGGRSRIYDTGSALPAAGATTTHCP